MSSIVSQGFRLNSHQLFEYSPPMFTGLLLQNTPDFEREDLSFREIDAAKNSIKN